MIKALRILFIFFIILFISSGWIAGAYMEPKVESWLTERFGFQVTVDGLYAHPFPGLVYTKKMVFHEQSGFEPRPHFEINGVFFDINFLALFDKDVEVGTLYLNEPTYLIDQRDPPDKGAPSTNIGTWYQNMKNRSKGKEKKPSSWTVSIDRIDLKDATIIIQDRREGAQNKRFYFQEVNGGLDGFHWPTPDPDDFDQDVFLKGLFGEINPRPFIIEGTGTFGTGEVGFDLMGKIDLGHVKDTRGFFGALPVEISGGQVELKIRAFCIRKDLNMLSDITFEKIEISHRDSIGDRIWGVPLKAWVGFVNDQDQLKLTIPVKGKIDDPEFQYYKAFDDAFWDAFKTKTLASFDKIKEYAAKLAGKAQEIPGAVVGKIGKSTGVIS